MARPSPDLTPPEGFVKRLGALAAESPENDQKVVFSLGCHVEFEPHGRASETWEHLWLLSFPTVHFYFKATTGWGLGHTTGVCMVFSGRTPAECYEKATKFLDDVPNPERINV